VIPLDNLSTMHRLGSQLRSFRKIRSLTQPELALRLGRDRARVSELERDLIHGRKSKDRLTLFLECCDALGIVPLLVPKEKYMEFAQSLTLTRQTSRPGDERNETFDDLFIDLSHDEDD
jgi:transcriptional regulator with XRE-family HTH domain